VELYAVVNLFSQFCNLVWTHLYPYFVRHLCSHSNLPGPPTGGNAQADNLDSGLALGLLMQTTTPVEASWLSHALYHQNASALCRQFHLISMPSHMLVRSQSLSSLIVWLCGVKDIFVFFLKMSNTQCGYHHSLSSLMDPLVPKMRRLRLEDLPQNREPLRLIPSPTRGRPRRQLPTRQMWDSEPPTWGKSKKLVTMATIETGNLWPHHTAGGISHNHNTGGCCPGRCILDIHAQPADGASYHLAEPVCTYLY
jgi:hypothetical protein